MNSVPLTEASRHLQALARRNAQVYCALSTTQAIILTGSAAEGSSDTLSDIDMIMYYDTLPSEEVLLMACKQNKGEERRLFGELEQGACLEIYKVQGVECQFAHTTVAAWERDIATVLEQLDVTSPLQKALAGTLDAIPLYGETLVRMWQARIAAYPDALAQAMVKHYLTIVPVWGIQQRLKSRDATLWHYQLLVEASLGILGILAALNHLYFSTFQFKRMHHFIGQMKIAPENLAARLEGLFHTDATLAAMRLEELVQEVADIVEQHMSDIDLTSLRKSIRWRQSHWQFA